MASKAKTYIVELGIEEIDNIVSALDQKEAKCRETSQSLRRLVAAGPVILPLVRATDPSIDSINRLTSLIDDSLVASLAGHPATEPTTEAIESADESSGEPADMSGHETNENPEDELWSLFNGEPGLARRRALSRLGLVSDTDNAVLALVLFCTLVGLCRMLVDSLTASLLKLALNATTGLALELVQVVFRHEVQQFLQNQVWG